MRALSWWVSWKDLEIGNNGVFDDIQRRADSFAAANADTAIIFGAHFRWDYLPYWDILHYYIREVAQALDERGLQLFDHHSCTLTHRYSRPEDLRPLMFRYMRHLPLVPSGEAVSSWQYNGEFINSWRTLDARTGQPMQVKQYSAEEYCINNPGFRAAYRRYLSRLLAETGIRGLMCDDMIWFGGFYQCACPCCRARLSFRLPAADDAGFWLNWSNPRWTEYLRMRRESVGEFVEYVKESLPEKFPLMSCCTSGAYGGNNYNAQSAHEFLRGDNRLNMEICGDEPGNVCEHLASGSYHAGISRMYQVPVTAIGYGFFPDSAEHLWALNHMNGFSTWFSTLKGNLGLTHEQLAQLPDDAAPASRAFAFEKEHPELFAGEQRSVCAVYFSETTKTDSYFGACETGSTLDYRSFMFRLCKAGIPAETIFVFPENAADIPCVFLPSAPVMTAQERESMEKYLSAGGYVFAFGPDDLTTFPAHPDSRPEDLHWLTHQDFPYEGRDEWREVRKGFFRNPSRTPSGIREIIAAHGRKIPGIKAEGYAVALRGNTAHLLALDYEIRLHPLDSLRKQRSSVSLTESAKPRNCGSVISAEKPMKLVYCPLGGEAVMAGNEIRLSGNPMYVIILFK